MSSSLALLEQLGRELRRLGWHPHLERTRELYAATRDGGRAEWSLEHAVRLASVLGLGETPLITASACPQCPPPLPGHWNGSRTNLHLPDRWVLACSRCGEEWVQERGAAPNSGAAPHAFIAPR